MNTQIALLGVVEILSALSSGIVILYLTYRLIKVYGTKRLGIKHGNLAYNILIASVLFSVGYTVSGVLQPILDSFRILARTEISSAEMIARFLVQGGIFIAIAYTMSIAVSLAGVLIYTAMTPMNEFREIKDNNIGVGIVVGTIIIVLTMFTKDGIILLIESFVPYPHLPPR